MNVWTDTIRVLEYCNATGIGWSSPMYHFMLLILFCIVSPHSIPIQCHSQNPACHVLPVQSFIISSHSIHIQCHGEIPACPVLHVQSTSPHSTPSCQCHGQILVRPVLHVQSHITSSHSIPSMPWSKPSLSCTTYLVLHHLIPFHPVNGQIPFPILPVQSYIISV